VPGVFTFCVYVFVVTVKNLMNETKEVVDYEHLGIQLDVSQAVIERISKEVLSKVELAKSKIYSYWIDNDPNASWEKLIEALKKIDKRSLATKLTGKLKGKCNAHIICAMFVLINFILPPTNSVILFIRADVKFHLYW